MNPDEKENVFGVEVNIGVSCMDSLPFSFGAGEALGVEVENGNLTGL